MCLSWLVYAIWMATEPLKGHFLLVESGGAALPHQAEVSQLVHLISASS